MFNTPPVFAVYATMLNMRWIKAQGGLISVGDKNSIKANMIYNEIDRNSKFKGFAAIEDRSEMNATFNLINEEEGIVFDSLWQSAGISGLKGHRSVGGYRASIYNALPLDSIKLLIDCMQAFENNA